MITIADLQSLRPILNFKSLALRAGIKYVTLDTKIRRGSELSVIQSAQIEEALKSFGLVYMQLTAKINKEM